MFIECQKRCGEMETISLSQQYHRVVCTVRSAAGYLGARRLTRADSARDRLQFSTSASHHSNSTMSSADDEYNQTRCLDAAKKVVKEQAFYMKRAIDGDKTELVFDHAMEMLRELNTDLLSPKSYYELYMKVQEELRELEDYLSSLQRNGRSMSELYEHVQSCVRVVPRLYLLCCVGGVYISSQDAPAKDILTDLVEIIKGVQHPMRGLFLRNYLTQVTKNRLPDSGSIYEGVGGSVSDAYNFVLQNFSEANRLWVRLQTQGSPKDKKKREKERLDLRILVGTNLVRLSQLEGLDAYEYETNVLPKILEEVIGCKDTIAQSYLMDCIIQVFPDELHLATLELFLSACTQLKEKVNIRTILESMIDRLTSTFSSGSSTGMGHISNAFTLFSNCVNSLIESHPALKLIDCLRLQTMLVSFALKCFPTHVEYVSHCLATSNSLVEKAGFMAQCAADREQEVKLVTDTILQIESLLLSPLPVLAMRVLEIPSYTALMALLPWDNWRGISSALLRSVIASNLPLSGPEELEKLFTSVIPLLRDEEGVPPPTDEDGRDLPPSQLFADEQVLVAKVVHLIKNSDTDIVVRMLVAARTHFAAGGSRRLQHTLTALVFSALSLVRRVVKRETAATNSVEIISSNGSTLESATPVSAPQFSARKVRVDFYDKFPLVLQILNLFCKSKYFPHHQFLHLFHTKGVPVRYGDHNDDGCFISSFRAGDEDILIRSTGGFSYKKLDDRSNPSYIFFPSTLLFLIFRGILIPLFSFYHWQYWACQY